MKTIIIGNSGSGKTWLSRLLATPDVEIIHLDELFWMPGGFDVKRGSEEVNMLIARSKEHAKWIAEGVFGELAKQYLADTRSVIWLDLPWDICRSRLIQRGSESKRHHDRHQSEEGLRKLLEWASHYYDRADLRSLSGHLSIFNSFQGDKVRLQSVVEIDQYIQLVKSGNQRC